MRVGSRGWVVAAWATLLMAANAQAEPHDSRQNIERGLLPAVQIPGRGDQAWTLRDRMDYYHVPGVSIAIIDDGKVAWTGAYGTRAAGYDAPLTPRHSFQAASISKPIAALVAILLVERGKVGLDNDLGKYLKSWGIGRISEAGTAPVTLRGLLSHTAGVNVPSFPGYAAGEPVPTSLQLLNGIPPAKSAAVRIEAIPGSRFQYSGGGYQLIERLIEAVTGKPFVDMARMLVFEPLKMRASGYAAPEKASAALGHGFNGSPINGGWKTYPENAAAGLWSTPADLARFAIAIMESSRGRPSSLLRRESALAMMAPPFEGAAGLGVGVHGQGASLYFDHSGWTSGYRSYLVAFPPLGDGIVVMTNGNGGDLLIKEIVRAAAKAYGWPAFAPESRQAAALSARDLDAFSGTYAIAEAGFSLTVAREDDHLIVSTPRGSRFTFFPSGPSSFFAIEDGSVMEFKDSSDGAKLVETWGLAGRRQ